MDFMRLSLSPSVLRAWRAFARDENHTQFDAMVGAYLTQIIVEEDCLHEVQASARRCAITSRKSSIRRAHALSRVADRIQLHLNLLPEVPLKRTWWQRLFRRGGS